MVIRHNGEQSIPRSLPGGGPQGGLLGALLFIVLVNDCCINKESNNVISNRDRIKSQW